MARREFFCPACGVSLQKSDAMMLLSEMHQGGGSYIANVTVDHINCPACGAAMPVKEVVAGKYDYAKGSLVSGVLGLALVGLMVFGIVKCAGG